MEQITKRQTIEKIIKKNGGFITRKDINQNNISSIFLYRYVRSNNLIKYCAGFYGREDWIKDDYLIIQYQHPQLIYSFSSAVYLHQLGDSIPLVVEVTGPKNYRPFHEARKDVVLHTDTRKDIYEMGIIEVENMFGHKVKVYDMEKTVCDFIRFRDKIDSESFVKCINAYKKRKDKNKRNLMEYSRKMKIEDEVNSLMEVILNED